MITSQEELEKFLDRRAKLFTEAINNLVEARFASSAAYVEAFNDIVGLVQGTMKLSDLHGRRRILLETDRFRRKTGKFAEDLGEKNQLFPSIPFEEAIDDLLSREPRLATPRTQEEVSRMYSYSHVFAMVRANELKITERVQKALAESMQKGKWFGWTTEILDEIGGWVRAYSETVYRTNVNTAYTAGRFQQTRDPDIQAVAPAFELAGIEDARERPNHAAARGLVAATDDPIWDTFRTPMGYNSYLPGNVIEGLVQSASKAFYSGPAITIKTGKGCRISVTINHPILTDSGFINAGKLTKGKYLVCYFPSVESFIHRVSNGTLSSIFETRGTIDDQYAPASIENIFDACRIQRTRSTPERFSRTFPIYFHADAAFYNGDIHIVGADGLLPDGGHEFFSYDSQHSSLMIRQRPSLLFSHGLSVSARAQPVRFGMGSNLDIPRDESISETSSGDAQLFRNLKKRFSADIFLDEIIDIDIDRKSTRLN